MLQARETLTTGDLREVRGDGGDAMMAMDWEYPCPCGERIAVRSEGGGAARAPGRALGGDDDDDDEGARANFPQSFQCPGCNFVIEVRFTSNELGSCFSRGRVRPGVGILRGRRRGGSSRTWSTHTTCGRP